MRHVRHDLRQAWSRLGRDRGFALLTITTLALGIGANSAVFSLVRGVLLQPLPYGNPDRLVAIWGPDLAETTWLSLQEIVSYGAEAQSFTAVAGYQELDAHLTGGQEPERVRAAAVTPNLFETVGVTALVGRVPSPSEVGNTPDAILLSHALWQRRFGGAPEIAGQGIQVNGRLRVVAGVMPAGFRLPGDYHAQRPVEAWLPEPINPNRLGAWGSRSFFGIARLAGTVPAPAVQQELSAIARRWVDAGYVQARPDGTLGALARQAVPVQAFVTGRVQRSLLLALGAVGFVLLIACANVANLQLARADLRQREVALRSALGASRGQIIRQLLTESVLLAVAGGLAGLGVAWAGLRLVIALRPAALPRVGEIGLDGPVLAATALLSLLTGLLFGLVPALHLSRPNEAATLNEGGRAATTSRTRHAVRAGLVVLQLASSLVLALGAGLLIRSLVEMTSIDLGFDADRVLTAQLQAPATDYPNPDDVVRLYREIDDRLAQLPGAVAAGAVRVLPLSRPIGDWSIRIEDRPYVAAENPNADFQAVTPGYFDAMRLRLVRGRLLTAADREDTMPVAVINETMADRYWPGQEVIGRQFMMGTDDKPWLTIVGIVRTVRHNAVIEDPRAEMYVAHAQLPGHIRSAPRGMALVVRTVGDPLSIAGGVREAVRGVDRNLPVSDIRTMADVAAQALSQPRFLTVLLGLFAGAAMVLAAVGIYGTISLLVAERTREMGIRLALGADRAAVIGLVLGEGARLAASGLVLGVLGALALSRVLSGVVYGVALLDPLTFLGVPVLLTLVAVLACVAPAWRAASIAPAVTLK
jgi:putative ABC transport system permease protein